MRLYKFPYICTKYAMLGCFAVTIFFVITNTRHLIGNYLNTTHSLQIKQFVTIEKLGNESHGLESVRVGTEARKDSHSDPDHPEDLRTTTRLGTILANLVRRVWHKRSSAPQQRITNVPTKLYHITPQQGTFYTKNPRSIALATPRVVPFDYGTHAYTAKRSQLMLNKVTLRPSVVQGPMLTPVVRTTPGLIATKTTNSKSHSTDAANAKRSMLKRARPFQVVVDAHEREMMFDLLNVFHRLMVRHRVNYFMYGGTLLGSYRHHDMIPWDDDVDVIANISVKLKLHSMVEKLKPRYSLVLAGGHGKMFRIDGKQTSAYSWKWPYLDISFFAENATHIWDDVYTYGYRPYFNKNSTFPLHLRPLGSFKYYAPADTFANLLWTYGSRTECRTFGYSHMVEGAGPGYRTISCETMSDRVAFVHRFPHPRGIREVLQLNGSVLHEIVVREPKYALSDAYRLTLQTGRYIPSNIQIPPQNYEPL